MPRIGTQVLVGPPLGRLPLHRGDRFPRSTPEPEPRSRHFNAGRHPSSKQAPLGLILGKRYPPSFDVIHTLSTSLQWFTCVRLLDSHLTQSRRAFSVTLTTMALNHSSLRWFGTCSCKPVPRGPPSSLLQHCVPSTAWSGGLGSAYLFTGPFVGRCLTSPSMPPFHLPLLKHAFVAH